MPRNSSRTPGCSATPTAARTATYHLRPFGRPQIEAYFGGTLAAELEAGGERAFFDFAVSELERLLGSDFARRVKPLHIHRWGADPFARGSYSYALPGKAAAAPRLPRRWTIACSLPAKPARRTIFRPRMAAVSPASPPPSR